MVVLCVIEYSDFLDKEMRRPGFECLPLGRRFQDHVKCFTKAKYVLLIKKVLWEILLQTCVISHRQCTTVNVHPVTERLIKQLEYVVAV